MNNEDVKEKVCLCIDTSTRAASVAAAKSAGENVEILYGTFVNDGLTHSENLVPLIDRCLSACKLSTKDIDIFACIIGPGSFTGLRIGISAANALAQSTDADIVGINSLESIAYNFKHFDGIILPMIDARRDNVYTAIFEASNGFKRNTEDEIKSIDEILEGLKDYKGKVLFAGDGSHKAKDRAKMLFSDKAVFADGAANNVSAFMGVEIAFRDYFSNNYNSGKVLMPNYVKGTSAKTQAERNRQGKK